MMSSAKEEEGEEEDPLSPLFHAREKRLSASRRRVGGDGAESSRARGRDEREVVREVRARNHDALGLRGGAGPWIFGESESLSRDVLGRSRECLRRYIS